MTINQLILWPFLAGLFCLAVALYIVTDLARRNRGSASMMELSRLIRRSTREFLQQEYLALGVLLGVVFILISCARLYRPKSELDWGVGAAFLLGALVTVLAGAIGMAVAVRANSRTAEAARLGGLNSALGVAMGGGSVMGLCVVGLSLIGLSAVLFLFGLGSVHIYAYALGASLVAMFIRLSGGIYTKGADIGADYITRSEPGFAENDARNAAVIADSVGDNIGNVVGIGSNLMESYMDAIIAAMSIGLTLHAKAGSGLTASILLPLLIAAASAVATVVGIFYIRNFVRNNLQVGLMLAPAISGGLTLAAAYFLVGRLSDAPPAQRMGIFVALATGFAAGGLSAFFSEIFTSYHYRPTRRISERSQFGSALAVLEGLSVGMRSSGVLTLILAATVAVAWRAAEFYGVAMAAFGMLAGVGVIVTINAFGPIVDNAGGLAEMVRMDRSVRDIMENLHGVSNMTTAMGKGFANCSAAFVALSMLLAFVKFSKLNPAAMSFDHPSVLAGLLIGAMFPFYVSSMMIHGVGSAASAMIDEVRRQIREIPGLREGKTRPDYARCTELATRRAVRGMLGPGLLVIATPVAIGLGFGKTTLVGFLAGALACSLALGFQMVNSGGAMDNAKKYIEEGYFGGKGSEAHRAAMVGDTVGDSFKDTVGPALAIVIKLMCVIALLIAPLLK